MLHLEYYVMASFQSFLPFLLGDPHLWTVPTLSRDCQLLCSLGSQTKKTSLTATEHVLKVSLLPVYANDDMNTYTYTHSCACICTHIHIHEYMHLYTCIHIHINMHTHYICAYTLILLIITNKV